MAIVGEPDEGRDEKLEREQAGTEGEKKRLRPVRQGGSEPGTVPPV